MGKKPNCKAKILDVVMRGLELIRADNRELVSTGEGGAAQGWDRSSTYQGEDPGQKGAKGKKESSC